MEPLQRALLTIWSLRPMVDVKTSKSGACIAASHFGIQAHGSLQLKDEVSEPEGVTGATQLRPDSVSTEVKVTGGKRSVALTFGLCGKHSTAKGASSPAPEVPADVDRL